MSTDFKLVMNSNVGFMPPCYPFLLSLKDSEIKIYHETHSRRHPLAAYTTTLERVESAFSSVMDSLDILRSDKNSMADELMERHRTLYYSLAEHFEACEGCAQSLVPKGEHKKHEKLTPFFNKASKYKHADKVINEIKHRHNSFVPIYLTCQYGTVHGFFVSGIRSSSSLGPNPTIHKIWNDQETAFSFSRDLRRLFVDLFRVGQYLADTLESFDIKPSTPDPREGLKLLHIARRISGLPNFCFPDEVHAPNQSVILDKEDGGFVLEVASGTDRAAPILPPGGNCHVSAHLTMGVERSYIMPYLQRRN